MLRTARAREFIQFVMTLMLPFDQLNALTFLGLREQNRLNPTLCVDRYLAPTENAERSRKLCAPKSCAKRSTDGASSFFSLNRKKCALLLSFNNNVRNELLISQKGYFITIQIVSYDKSRTIYDLHCIHYDLKNLRSRSYDLFFSVQKSCKYN